MDWKQLLADVWPIVCDYVVRYRVWLAGGFGILILYGLWRRWRKNCAPIRAFSNEVGEFLVTRQAIVTLIQTACADGLIGTIKRVHLIDKKRALLVKLHVILRGAQAGQALEQLQAYIQNAIVTTIGSMKKVQVDVLIEGIKNVPNASRKDGIEVTAESITSSLSSDDHESV